MFAELLYKIYRVAYIYQPTFNLDLTLNNNN